MALALTLKSKERMIIGEAVISNAGQHSAHLLVETEVPVLRKRDILPIAQANTPCGQIYMVLQLMYIYPERETEYQGMYLDLVRDVSAAAPSLRPLLEEISIAVARSGYYQALPIAKKLLRREQELLAGQSNINESDANELTSNSAQGQHYGLALP